MTKIAHANVIDELNDAIRTAYGIEAALEGLECINDSQKIGVAWLQTMSIEALEAIRNRLSKAQDREGRWLQTAQIEEDAA
jgi:hypothetical protein